jgi:hypothetical protein
MGLDMYLNGERYLGAFTPSYEQKPLPCLESEKHRLGYWRKHPNLHGYIVETFADGVDECQEIGLTEENILQIMEAIRARALPHTVGFFFGQSEGDAQEMREDIAIFQRALDWVRAKEDHVRRWVTYRASW